SSASITALELAQGCFTISPGMATEQVLDLMLGDRNLMAIPVIETDGRPIGLVLRSEMVDRFSQRYWRELHG
ncbi:CBS domain-containing protein, partial [Klebsiella pneumoniae]|uniref:CBS domain-containing protein n=1 Tax=Klebsiella pneumoniae TaxID=573 RepID=UPI003EDEAAA6